MRGNVGVGVMGDAGSVHSSFLIVDVSRVRSSSIEDGVADGISVLFLPVEG